MLSERRRRVLQALVEEYVSSAVPVGSATLVSRHELGCSPATVRSELSILEETGYVRQPHVSAGRVPTDSGYRSFVDDMLERTTPQVAQVDAPELHHTAELDELMRQTSSALMRLTSCLAVSIAPSAGAGAVKRLNVVPISPRRLLTVLITESGRVVNRTIEVETDLDAPQVARLEARMNDALVGKRAAEIRVAGRPTLADAPDHLYELLARQIAEALEESDRDRLFSIGIPALLAQPEFHDAERVRPLIEFLEDGFAVLDALADALVRRDVLVRIGHENVRAELGDVSVVATSYSAGSQDGVVAVIGPTRMDYQRAIGAVRGVACELEEALGQ